MATAPIRVALVTVALLVGAWLALGVRAVDLESERTVSSLRDARFLSVDKAPLVREALALFAEGRHEMALAAAKRVVREEPDNLEGWLALSYFYAAAHDSGRTADALRHARALNPLVRPGVPVP